LHYCSCLHINYYPDKNVVSGVYELFSYFLLNVFTEWLEIIMNQKKVSLPLKNLIRERSIDPIKLNKSSLRHPNENYRPVYIAKFIKSRYTASCPLLYNKTLCVSLLLFFKIISHLFIALSLSLLLSLKTFLIYS
jgi:hypothetical protein